MVHDDDYYGSENSDHHVRLVWAKAPGVMCLLPPRHQADDEDEVNQSMMTMGSKTTWVKTANIRGALPGKDYEFQPEQNNIVLSPEIPLKESNKLEQLE